MNHLLSAEQFTQEYIGEVVQQAAIIDAKLGHEAGERDLANTWPTGRLVSVFYEPSTRTRGSTEAAAKILGMGYISTPNAAQDCKSETIEDAAIMYGAQGHVVVIRHPEDDAVARAATAIDTYFKGYRHPTVINAGSGERDHPSQALVDAYAIHNEFSGQQTNLHTVLVGGLNNRTVRSYIQLRRLFEGNSFTLVAPLNKPELRPPDDILEYLQIHDMPFTIAHDLHEVLRDPSVNIVYAGRIKNERRDNEPLPPPFVIGEKEVELLRPDARVLHALPRAGEVDPFIDHLEQAAFMRQAIGAVAVRAAILLKILDKRHEQRLSQDPATVLIHG